MRVESPYDLEKIFQWKFVPLLSKEASGFKKSFLNITESKPCRVSLAGSTFICLLFASQFTSLINRYELNSSSTADKMKINFRTQWFRVSYSELPMKIKPTPVASQLKMLQTEHVCVRVYKKVEKFQFLF